MAGTIAADTLTHSSAGSLDTQFVVKGSAKVWAKYDAGSTLNDSFNVSSLADVGTGQYEPSFTNNMSNANYPAMAQGNNSGFCSYASSETTGENTTSKFRQMCRSSSHSAFDATFNRCIVNGDLA